MKDQLRLFTEQGGPCFINYVLVRDLFGEFSYNLRFESKVDEPSVKLSILYGDNGSGKTTILNLIYHLLSPEPYEGHRSYVGRCPFSRFEIGLSNGVSIRATREQGSDAGAYDVALVYGNKDFVWSWHPERTGRDAPDATRYEVFCNFLSQLELKFHYLRDSRRVAGREPRPDDPNQLAYSNYIVTREFPFGEAPGRRIHDNDMVLMESMNRALEWFRKRALAGTNVGASSVNSIYKDIVSSIVTYGQSETTVGSDSVAPLIKELQELRERNKGFAEFGLTPPLVIDELISSLTAASSSHVPLLKSILSPYLEGHRARLDALQEVQRVMNDFVSLLGEFYSNKHVVFQLNDGLTIRSARTSKEIHPSLLSSGERQLLLLLCHAVSIRDAGPVTVFMVDEPEISLNVKWQRKFVEALLTCLSGTSSQLILATHSIELLTKYADRVVTLEEVAH